MFYLNSSQKISDGAKYQDSTLIEISILHIHYTEIIYLWQRKLK